MKSENILKQSKEYGHSVSLKMKGNKECWEAKEIHLESHWDFDSALKVSAFLFKSW